MATARYLEQIPLTFNIQETNRVLVCDALSKYLADLAVQALFIKLSELPLEKDQSVFNPLYDNCHQVYIALSVAILQSKGLKGKDKTARQEIVYNIKTALEAYRQSWTTYKLAASEDARDGYINARKILLKSRQQAEVYLATTQDFSKIPAEVDYTRTQLEGDAPKQQIGKRQVAAQRARFERLADDLIGLASAKKVEDLTGVHFNTIDEALKDISTSLEFTVADKSEKNGTGNPQDLLTARKRAIDVVLPCAIDAHLKALSYEEDALIEKTGNQLKSVIENSTSLINANTLPNIAIPALDGVYIRLGEVETEIAVVAKQKRHIEPLTKQRIAENHGFVTGIVIDTTKGRGAVSSTAAASHRGTRTAPISGAGVARTAQDATVSAASSSAASSAASSDAPGTAAGTVGQPSQPSKPKRPPAPPKRPNYPDPFEAARRAALKSSTMAGQSSPPSSDTDGLMSTDAPRQPRGSVVGAFVDAFKDTAQSVGQRLGLTLGHQDEKSETLPQSVAASSAGTPSSGIPQQKPYHGLDTFKAASVGKNPKQEKAQRKQRQSYMPVPNGASAQTPSPESGSDAMNVTVRNPLPTAASLAVYVDTDVKGTPPGHADGSSSSPANTGAPFLSTPAAASNAPRIITHGMRSGMEQAHQGGQRAARPSFTGGFSQNSRNPNSSAITVVVAGGSSAANNRGAQNPEVVRAAQVIQTADRRQKAVMVFNSRFKECLKSLTWKNMVFLAAAGLLIAFMVLIFMGLDGKELFAPVFRRPVGPSESPTPTATPSISFLPAPIQPGNATISASPAGATTQPGATVSATASETIYTSTGTATRTSTVTSVITPTGSGTASITTTVTTTITPAGSTTPSSTTTTTTTAVVTPSATPSGTASLSVSASVTPSGTATITISASNSPTATTTMTVSNTPSSSPTASVTASPTQTPTASITRSSTASPTVTPTSSITTSSTGTASATGTPVTQQFIILNGAVNQVFPITIASNITDTTGINSVILDASGLTTAVCLQVGTTACRRAQVTVNNLATSIAFRIDNATANSNVGSLTYVGQNNSVPVPGRSGTISLAINPTPTPAPSARLLFEEAGSINWAEQCNSALCWYEYPHKEEPNPVPMPTEFGR